MGKPRMAEMPETAGIADRLRTLRMEHELSCHKLADGLEVTESAVSSWERGLYIPSTFAVMRYAEYFGVSTDWILFGREYDGR